MAEDWQEMVLYLVALHVIECKDDRTSQTLRIVSKSMNSFILDHLQGMKTTTQLFTCNCLAAPVALHPRRVYVTAVFKTSMGHLPILL
jgi:hypothetical protein